MRTHFMLWEQFFRPSLKAMRTLVIRPLQGNGNTASLSYPDTWVRKPDCLHLPYTYACLCYWVLCLAENHELWCLLFFYVTGGEKDNSDLDTDTVLGLSHLMHPVLPTTQAVVGLSFLVSACCTWKCSDESWTQLDVTCRWKNSRGQAIFSKGIPAAQLSEGEIR